MTRILQTDEYRLTRCDPSEPSRIAVVTWMALRAEASATEDSPFPPEKGQDFVSRAGLVSLRVAARRNDWYQRPTHDAVLDAAAFLRALAARVERASQAGAAAPADAAATRSKPTKKRGSA